MKILIKLQANALSNVRKIILFTISCIQYCNVSYNIYGIFTYMYLPIKSNDLFILIFDCAYDSYLT